MQDMCLGRGAILYGRAPLSIRATRENTLALRLVCKHPDLWAG